MRRPLGRRFFLCPLSPPAGGSVSAGTSLESTSFPRCGTSPPCRTRDARAPYGALAALRSAWGELDQAFPEGISFSTPISNFDDDDPAPMQRRPCTGEHAIRMPDCLIIEYQGIGREGGAFGQTRVKALYIRPTRLASSPARGTSDTGWNWAASRFAWGRCWISLR